MSEADQKIQIASALGNEALANLDAAVETAEQFRQKCAKGDRAILRSIADLKGVTDKDFARGRSLGASWKRAIFTVRADEQALQRSVARKLKRMQFLLHYYRYRWRVLKIAAAIAVLCIIYIFWPEIVGAAGYIWGLIEELNSQISSIVAGDVDNKRPR